MIQIIVLAIVQGITEFLPISSSGHLAAVPHLMDWPDQGLDLDIAVHVGTLGAVCLYFWRDLWGMLKALFKPLRKDNKPYIYLLFYLIIATIPVAAAGFFGKHLVEQYTRSLPIIAWTTLGFAVLLFIADKISMTVNRLEHLNIVKAFIIGLFQVLALIPGVSRAGITMTAARFLGFERAEAARFSMLLSIPTIIGAGLLAGRDILAKGDPFLTETALMAAGLAFITALMAIAVLMSWLKRSTFTPFVVYRLALGGGLLYLIYS